MALAIEMKVILDSGVKTLLVVRDVINNMPSASYDIVVSYNYVFVESEEVFAELNKEDVYVLRKPLHSSCFYNLGSIKEAGCKEWVVKEVTTIIMKNVLEVVERPEAMAWETEPLNEEVMQQMVRLSKGKDVIFCVTGRMKEGPYENKEVMFAKRTELMAAVCTLLEAEEDKQIFKISHDLLRSVSSVPSLHQMVETWSKGIREKDIDLYMRGRHEILHNTLMEQLGLEAAASDVSAEQRFNYTGLDSKKTPDFFFTDQETGTVHIVDVAVTAMEAGTVYDNKLSKYTFLARELERFLGVDCVVSPVVMSCEESGIILMSRIFDNVRPALMDLQQELIEIHKNLKNCEGFTFAYRAYLASMDMQEMAEKTQLMDLFIKAYCNFQKLDNKLAPELMDSFVRESSDMDSLWTTPSDDEIVQMVKEDLKTFSENQAFQEIYSEISNGVMNNRFPLAVQKIFRPINIKEEVRKCLAEGKKIRNRSKNRKFKIPRIFKFPDLANMIPNSAPLQDDGLGKLAGVLEDGTRRYDSHFTIPTEAPVENREGIGMDPEEDVAMITDLINDMKQASSIEFQEQMREYFGDRYNQRIQAICKLRIIEVAYRVSKLANNICLMEGRRLDDSDVYSVMKPFQEEGYSLEVMKGSRLTAEKQIRYRLASLDKGDVSQHFHSFYKDGFLYYTQWLAISSTDLRTMLCMFEKAIALMLHYMDCWEEGSGTKIINLDLFVKKDFMIMPLIILMEMKRGTSTTCQYNRYILMSMLGYVSDKVKAVRDIISDPIRSRLEAYIRIKQLLWAESLTECAWQVMKSSICQTVSRESEYDRMMAPSIFSNNEYVEFTFLMNDIYLGNLFQKEAGFVGHRSKLIIQKMMKEEFHYLAIRDPMTLNSDLTVEDTFNKEDEKHVFSKRFVMLMGKRLGKKLKESGSYHQTLIRRLTDNIHSAMMMSSSLKGGPVKTQTLIDHSDQLNDLSFSTIKDLVDKYGTSVMSGMISRENLIEAVFSMFPKSQIGGPREILIQSYRLRLHVRFFENLCEGFCYLHPKEMITKGDKKEHIQSSTAMDHKRLLNFKKDRENKYGLSFSLNSDASRWAPSFTMTMFTYFLYSLELPEEITDHAASIMKAFASKLIFLPRSLKKKWIKKVEEETEDIMQWTKERASLNHWSLKVFSGMGQGMIHKFSSLIHVAKDDVLDDMLKLHFKRINCDLEMTTMISSDDLLKQVLINGHDLTTLFIRIKDFVSFYECTNMLANIHTNWKKTCVSFVISEFNSYFTRGKRASLAVIKDIFTAMEPVDMTEPNKAVKDAANNIARAFKNGCYLETVEMMFFLMRKWLLGKYKYHASQIQELMTALNCDSEHKLPSDFGFLSCDYVMGQCIFGNEILMFRSDNSEEVNTFYKNLYTALKEEYEGLTADNYISALSGKIRLVLPYRTDKRLSKMIQKYMDVNHLKRDTIMSDQQKISLLSDMSKMSRMKYYSFIDPYFMSTKRNYEHGVTMQIHTVVRALQAGNGKMMAVPSVSKTTRLYSALSFCKEILSRSELPSSQLIMKPLQKVMAIVEEAKAKEAICFPSDGTRHTRKRIFTFRTRELVLSADMSEILYFIINNQWKLSNRLNGILRDICELLNVSEDEFRSDPISVITNTLSFSTWPMLVFKKMLEEYLVNRINNRIEIMLSDVDTGCAIDNLMIVYCERKSPVELFKIDARSRLIVLKEYYSTWVALYRANWEFPIKQLVEEHPYETNLEHITPGDTVVDRGMKLILKDMNLVNSLTSSFVFHTYRKGDEDSIYHVYYDLRDLLILNINKKRRAVTYYFVTEENEIDMESQLWRFAKNDIRAADAITYSQVYSDGVIISINPIKSWKDVKYRLFLSCSNTTWTMTMKVLWNKIHDIYFNQAVFTIFKEPYKIYEERIETLSILLNDREYIHEFTVFRMGEMSLLHLQNFMERYKLHTEEILGRRTDTERERRNVKPLSEEVDDFGMVVSSMEFIQSFMKFGGADDYLDDLQAQQLPELDVIRPEDEFALIQGLEDGSLEQLLSAFENNEEREIVNIPVKNRLYMARMISEALMKAMDRDLIIDYETICCNLTSNAEWNSKHWNLMVTILHMEIPQLFDWMLRLIMTIIYLKVRRSRRIPVPGKLIITENFTRYREFTMIRKKMRNIPEDVLEDF
uniref:RNA-directed RNA polymerase L n=1 Tax=Schistocephalus solidus bunya-like virus TaxID=2729338 RepID=A0A6M3RSD3_9VIRU|nr:polymerase [Schistocephalus solidus bunya-like virus]